MSIQDTSAKLSHNKELNGFKINLDSHYDFFKDDPDYGVYLKISNVNYQTGTFNDATTGVGN